MRMTRAAAAAAHIHVDEVDPIEAEELLSQSQSVQGKDERAPLGEISGNGVDGEAELSASSATTGRSTRSRSKRGGQRSVRTESEEGDVEEDEQNGKQMEQRDNEEEFLELEQKHQQEAEDGDVVMEDAGEGAEADGAGPVSPPSSSKRMTRRQLAALQEAAAAQEAQEGHEAQEVEGVPEVQDFSLHAPNTRDVQEEDDTDELQDLPEVPTEFDIPELVGGRESTSSHKSGSIAPTSILNQVKTENGMVFDPQRMLWTKSAGADEEEEDDPFAGIDDLEEEPQAAPIVAKEEEKDGEITPAVEMEDPIPLPKQRTPAMTPAKTPAKNFQKKEVLGMRSTSNKENEQPFSPVVPRSPAVQSATATPQVGMPPTVDGITSPTRSVPPEPATAQDPIEALDALNEAIAEVDASIPKVDPVASADEKDKPKTLASTRVRPTGRSSSIIRDSTKKPTSRPSTIVRTGSVRQSVAPRAEPRQNSTLNRASSVRKPMSRPSVAPPERDMVATKAFSSARISEAGNKPADKTTAKIPHSKPRPISLNFPTPPPPPKSSRPPTKATFQLPGEAVAAKLKAAREARLAREASAQPIKDRNVASADPTKKVSSARLAPRTTETKPFVRQTSTSRARQSIALDNEADELAKRRAFKARPAPNMTAKPTIRQTSASMARQSLMLGKESEEAAGLKRAGSVREPVGKKPITSTMAAKRLSHAPKTGGVPPRVGASTATTTAAKKENAPPAALTVAKRGSVAVTTSPTFSASTDTIQRVTSNPTKGTAKGKEVFKRAALEKEKEEKAKREKEDAARKARAEAAEKGRIASREWAEKMKKKMGFGKDKEKEVVVA